VFTSFFGVIPKVVFVRGNSTLFYFHLQAFLSTYPHLLTKKEKEAKRKKGLLLAFLPLPPLKLYSYLKGFLRKKTKKHNVFKYTVAPFCF